MLRPHSSQARNIQTSPASQWVISLPRPYFHNDSMPYESCTKHAPNALPSFCRQTTQTLRQSYASPRRRSSPTSASSPPTLSPAIWLFERQLASYPDSCSGLDKHILSRNGLRRVLKTEDWSCPPLHRDWTSLERERERNIFQSLCCNCLTFKYIYSFSMFFF